MPKRSDGEPPYRATTGRFSDGRLVRIDHIGYHEAGPYISIELHQDDTAWNTIRIGMTVQDADKLVQMIKEASAKALVDNELQK